MDEAAIRSALRAGLAHHEAGRLPQAEAIYREVLDAAPGRPDAMVLLADVARRAGRLEAAAELLRGALRASPGVPSYHQQLGAVLAAMGRLDEAAACFREAAARKPDFALAHNSLGETLYALGELDGALASFRRALALEDRPRFRENFARCVALASRLPADAALRPLLARALREGWARPADLARAAIALLGTDPAWRDALAADARAPGGDAAALAAGAAAMALPDGLLGALLDHAQACDPALERLLTAARRGLLQHAAGAPARGDPGAILAFGCALARQCFLGDYVFAAGEAELDAAAALRARLEAALADAGPVPDLWPAAVGAYFPLAPLAGAEALAARQWPGPVRALLRPLLAEPAEERGLRETMPRLTPVQDAVSQRVRRQYEESPYPRWVLPAPVEPVPLDVHVRALFPHAVFRPLGREAFDLLVAGCGTGQEPVELARRFPAARVLAVDLSLASLAYAARKAREARVANLAFGQADILAIDALDRRFDLVSAVGVLHHLADPVAGWGKLARVLRPGGFMQVGLYSEAARRDVVAARAFIAERRYAPTPDGIRRCRQALLAAPEHAGVAALRDFYGMHECRDLLFHVEEHRFTLEEVGRALAALGLELLGIVAGPAAHARYRARFPGEARAADLAHWSAVERDHPGTFAGMYLLWAQKPASAGDAP